MKNRIINLTLFTVLILILAACSNKKNEESNEDRVNSKISTDNKNNTTNFLTNQINDVLTTGEYRNKKIVEQNFNEDLGTIKFGSYWQSDSTGNVKDVIEWYVVKKEANKALLVSKFVLDGKVYNDIYDENHHITWEESTIRQWLNDSFYNEAFTNEEKKYITNENIVNKDHSYGTRTIRGGNNTKDNVFLLSFDEANDLFFRETEGTNYLLSHLGNNFEFWWLRSPGGYISRAGNVGRTGLPSDDGNKVDEIGGIRPAIWVQY